MANKHRGVVELKGSDGQKYKLKFGTNAICKIEERHNKSIGEVLNSLTDEKTLRVSTLRELVQVSMKGDPDPEAVGDLIDDVGMDEIAKVFTAMFGEEKKDEKPADPQPASELTGVSVS